MAIAFDDSKDYPFSSGLAGLARSTAVTTVKGSVEFYAARHAFTQKPTSERTPVEKDEFAREIYERARTKGLNKAEAADVREKMVAKFANASPAPIPPPSSQKTPKEKKARKKSKNRDEESAVSSQLPTNTSEPAAPESSLPSDGSASIPKKGKKRSRDDENGVDDHSADEGSKKKKKKHRKSDSAIDEAAPEGLKKHKKAGRKSAPASSAVEASALQESPGRRSRSTSLGELGPSERSGSALGERQNPGTSKHKLNKDKKKKRRKDASKQQTVHFEDVEEPEVLEESDIADGGAAEDAPQDDVDMRSPSPWEEEDHRPTFVVNMNQESEPQANSVANGEDPFIVGDDDAPVQDAPSIVEEEEDDDGTAVDPPKRTEQSSEPEKGKRKRRTKAEMEEYRARVDEKKRQRQAQKEAKQAAKEAKQAAKEAKQAEKEAKKQQKAEKALQREQKKQMRKDKPAEVDHSEADHSEAEPQDNDGHFAPDMDSLLEKIAELERRLAAKDSELAKRNEEIAGLRASTQPPDVAATDLQQHLDVPARKEPSQQPSPNESHAEDDAPSTPKAAAAGKLSKPNKPSSAAKSASQAARKANGNVVADKPFINHRPANDEDWSIPETPSPAKPKRKRGRPSKASLRALESPELGSNMTPMDSNQERAQDTIIPSTLPETETPPLLPPVELSSQDTTKTSKQRSLSGGKEFAQPATIGSSPPEPGPQQDKPDEISDTSSTDSESETDTDSEKEDSMPTVSPRADEIQDMINTQLNSDMAHSLSQPEKKKRGPKKKTDQEPVSADKEPAPAKKTSPKKKTDKTSPHFEDKEAKASSNEKKAAKSAIEFPSISADKFGLIQEDLASEPFKLLVASIFLNQTKGTAAIPVFHRFMEEYPTVDALATAEVKDIVSILETLGLQNNKAKTLIELAKKWQATPPTKGKRFRTPNYPTREDAKLVKTDEVLSDDDPRLAALEVGHLPGCGAYAWDGWRIFCRDICRGVAQGWNAEGAEEGFQPEWMRVLPKDKELKQFLRWMWLKEGYSWSPTTGEKEVASREMLERAEKGGKAPRMSKKSGARLNGNEEEGEEGPAKKKRKVTAKAVDGDEVGAEAGPSKTSSAKQKSMPKSNEMVDDDSDSDSSTSTSDDSSEDEDQANIKKGTSGKDGKKVARRNFSQ